MARFSRRVLQHGGCVGWRRETYPSRFETLLFGTANAYITNTSPHHPAENNKLKSISALTMAVNVSLLRVLLFSCIEQPQRAPPFAVR